MELSCLAENVMKGNISPTASYSTDIFDRFEDEELGHKRPATADAAMLSDGDWMGLGSEKQKKRPLGLASTVDFSSGGMDDDWLDMASSR